MLLVKRILDAYRKLGLRPCRKHYADLRHACPLSALTMARNERVRGAADLSPDVGSYMAGAVATFIRNTSAKYGFIDGIDGNAPFWSLTEPEDNEPLRRVYLIWYGIGRDVYAHLRPVLGDF